MRYCSHLAGRADRRWRQRLQSPWYYFQAQKELRNWNSRNQQSHQDSNRCRSPQTILYLGLGNYKVAQRWESLDQEPNLLLGVVSDLELLALYCCRLVLCLPRLVLFVLGRALFAALRAVVKLLDSYLRSC